MPRATTRGPRGALLAVGLSVVPLLACASFLGADLVPVHRDLLVFVLPFKHFLAASLRSGEIPLWNPWIFLGTPFLGSLQAGVFYPPSLLVSLPFPLGFDLLLVFHYELALIGMCLFLRDRGLAPAASAVGGLTFCLGGYLVSLLSLTNHLQSAAWAPWLLIAWRRWTATRSVAGWLAVAAVIVLQLLAGSPEHLLMTIAAAVCCRWLEGSRGWASLGEHAAMLAAACGLAAAAAAFQILPTIEYLGESTRSDPIDAAQVFHWSLQPVSLLGLLFRDVPRTAVEPLIGSLYPGVASLCLAVAALSRRRGRPWLVIAAAGLVLAFGDRLPVLPLLHDLAPELFARFRYPEKFYFLVHLGVAILAAEGADLVVRADPRARRPATLTAVSCGLAGAIVFWLHGAEQPVAAGRDLAAGLIHLLAVLGVFIALLGLRRADWIGRGSFAALLLALVAVDLVPISGIAAQTASWSELSSRPAIIDVEEMRSSHQRIFHYQAHRPAAAGDGGSVAGWPAAPGDEGVAQLWSALFGDVGMVYGVANLSGAEGFLPKSVELLLGVLPRLSREAALQLLRAFSIAYLVGPDARESPSLQPVEPRQPSRYFAYRLRDALPIAYLASRLRRIPDGAAALEAIAAPGFELGGEAVVSELPPGWSDPVGEHRRGAVAVLSYGDDAVRLRASCREGAFLVLNDAFFPGWEARVDGARVEIIRTNALVRGIALAAGDHDVDFVYRPRSLRWGALISGAALILAAALGAAVGRVPGRRGAAPAVEIRREGSRH